MGGTPPYLVPSSPYPNPSRWDTPSCLAGATLEDRPQRQETAKPGVLLNAPAAHILEWMGRLWVENLKPSQRNLDQLDPRKRERAGQLKIFSKPVAARDEPGEEDTGQIWKDLDATPRTHGSHCRA